MTVVIKPDPNEGNKFSVRGMHYTYGLHGIVLAVDYVSPNSSSIFLIISLGFFPLFAHMDYPII